MIECNYFLKKLGEGGEKSYRKRQKEGRAEGMEGRNEGQPEGRDGGREKAREGGKKINEGRREKSICGAVKKQLNETRCSFCKMPKFAASMSNKIPLKKIRHSCEFLQTSFLVYMLTSLQNSSML